MPKTAEKYTESLLARGQERKRLTSQLVSLVAKVADQIAETVPVGTTVEVGGEVYKTVRLNSNIGSQRFLAVLVGGEEPFADYEVFDDDTPGREYYLHNDFRVPVRVASREAFLHLANNLPAVVKAFATEEEKVIAELRAAFERLRSIAGAE